MRQSSPWPSATATTPSLRGQRDSRGGVRPFWEERRPEALFIRYDVFSSLADPRQAPAFRSLAWLTAVSGWAIAHPEVKMFNRESALHVTNKLHVLHSAREVGLDIPRTLVTNDHALLLKKSERESPGITRARCPTPENRAAAGRQSSGAVASRRPSTAWRRSGARSTWSAAM